MAEYGYNIEAKNKWNIIVVYFFAFKESMFACVFYQLHVSMTYYFSIHYIQNDISKI